MTSIQTTVGKALIASLRRAGTYTSGDQVKPCTILWTDPQKLWINAIGEIKALLHRSAFPKSGLIAMAY
jgi:hypothetical protein